MKRAASFLSFLAIAVAGGVILAWVLSRLVSDRWRWSQWVFWVPSAAFAGAGLALWVASWLSAAFAGARMVRGRLRRPWRRSRAAVGLGLGVLLAYIALVELRLGNALWRPRPAGAALRIVNWNLTQLDSADAVAAAVGPLGPDLAVFANNPSHPEWRRLLGELGLGGHVATQQTIHIASRLPIVRYGSGLLGLPEPLEEKSGRPAAGARYDPGRAMYAEIDTRAVLGRAIVVWVIDMPSDERLSRRELAGQAARAIASWTGPEVRPGSPGESRVQGGPGFPPPDLIIGDFNIPRGSASLHQLTGGLRNAFDETGWGYCATWPRRRPLVHIDQTFVAPTLRAVWYDTRDPGYGYHRLQVVDIVAAPAP